MLKFLVFDQDQPPTDWPLRNTYLLGGDGTPIMRGEIVFEDGAIVAEKREAGAAALVLQHEVAELGELTLQTCLLPERDEPYVLSIELARHRVMILYTRLEDWGLFELDPDHPVTERTEQARQLFIEALSVQGEDTLAADRLAQQSLAIALDASEELALTHSQIMLNRRRRTQTLPEHPIGCLAPFEMSQDRVLRQALPGNIDFLHLPTPWKSLAPEEGDYNWQVMDAWVRWARKHQMPIVAGPLLSFDTFNLPDWLFIWEHDYETVRDLAYEHIDRVINRYKEHVSVWYAASGLHLNRHIAFNFEQLMELTRLAAMRVKKLAPQAKSIIELREPFGEYYATNARSIPPMTYADLVVQAGISFDGFGLQFLMGQSQPGHYARDLMQISTMVEQYTAFGKPVYFTAGAPSEPVTQMMIADADASEPVDDNSGYWRRPWSGQVQGHWLEAVMQIALSKPGVEGVAWQELNDHRAMALPLSGLLTEELEVKDAFSRLVSFRKSLVAEPGAAMRDEPLGAAPPQEQADKSVRDEA
ncbi:MAG: endo-1,4-beta-xylanase [Phycisphaeraceae bacterium]